MTAFTEYVREIRKNLERGDSTEHTHRPALKTLLESCGKDIVATNEPRRIACGAPDFNITRNGVPLGHVEAKDVGANLDEMERARGPNGEQYTRYRDGLPNWILTDYLEFRWFVNGEKRLTVCVAELDAKGKVRPLPDGEEKLTQLLTAFFEQEALTVRTAKELAGRMAGMTRIIRDLIVKTLEHEKEQGWLHNWLAAFRETLIPELDEKQFADMFAQTLAYGLFAAFVNTPANKEFSREMAAYNLPKTNPFLRKLLAEIAGVDMPDSIVWAVNDIVELLKHADMFEILKDFGKGKGKEDPVVHFYETFLAAYDPKMRKVRGVFYTPEPVVSYIVRSIDCLLKTRFNRPKGLADENTLILDPATGTATFLYFVIDQIYQTFAKQAGAWDGYVAKHLLNRIFGFELLMAPYAVAHLKIGMQLQGTGYKFGSDQRLGIYLTNTLEEAAKQSEQLFAQWISDEANAASKIKRDDPILVILGNPPYSNFGQMNRNPWILGLLDDYKKDLNEKKLNLDDDFIKFIRFSQWRIERTGFGVLGFITNNTYIDGLTHRRMRQALMESFDEIYILNLHGSSKKQEETPDGGKDENVFDITVGVSIALFVKVPKGKALSPKAPPNDGGLVPPQRGHPTKIFHADLWGKRENKYAWLWQNVASSTPWTPLQPIAPNFFFVPKDGDNAAEHNTGWSLKDIFLVSGNATKTERDHLSIHFDAADIQGVVADFRKLGESELREKYGLQEDSRDWKVLKAKADVLKNTDPACFRPILYRPFDIRHTWYSGQSRGFIGTPGYPVMRHMPAGENLALLACRQVIAGDYFHVFCASKISECCTVSNRTREITSAFPLYLYPAADELVHTDGRQVNFAPAFVKALAEKLKLRQTEPHGLPKGITPEDIFHYAYAVFHSPTYRTRYAEFLKIDFPRLPLTGDVKLFRALAAKGAELVALHLLESPKIEDFLTDWPVKGDNVVEKALYTENDKRVWINKTQYFGGVPKPVWEFHIGGYQVCQKWLKDRKGRKLNYEDTQHYQKIVVALNETIRLMRDIDEVIGRHGGWPIQ